MRGKKISGFTLVELLVVIGIILVVMGISVPSLMNFSRGQRLKQSGNVISGMLSEARSIAVTQRRPVRVAFFHDAEDDEYGAAIYYVDRDGKARIDAKRFNKGVKIVHEEYQTPNSNIYVFKLKDDQEAPEEGDFTESGFDGDAGKIEFRRDGTIEFYPDYIDIPPAVIDGKDLFDRNADFTRLKLADVQCDILLSQDIGTERCFVEIDANSGRAFSRVVETGAE